MSRENQRYALDAHLSNSTMDDIIRMAQQFTDMFTDNDFGVQSEIVTVFSRTGSLAADDDFDDWRQPEHFSLGSNPSRGRERSRSPNYRVGAQSQQSLYIQNDGGIHGGRRGHEDIYSPGQDNRVSSQSNRRRQPSRRIGGRQSHQNQPHDLQLSRNDNQDETTERHLEAGGARSFYQNSGEASRPWEPDDFTMEGSECWGF